MYAKAGKLLLQLRGKVRQPHRSIAENRQEIAEKSMLLQRIGERCWRQCRWRRAHPQPHLGLRILIRIFIGQRVHCGYVASAGRLESRYETAFEELIRCQERFA